MRYEEIFVRRNILGAKLIMSDVKAAVKEGRTPIVLSDRIESLFSAAKISRLKNTAEFAYRQTSLIDVCAFRAPMQQSSRIDILSTVAF